MTILLTVQLKSRSIVYLYIQKKSYRIIQFLYACEWILQYSNKINLT